MISDEGRKDAMSEADVEQKVNDCLQDWSAASSKAVQEMMEKQRQQDAAEAAEAARAQFVISLIGNLAWAATVFFAPAAAIVPVRSVAPFRAYQGTYGTLQNIELFSESSAASATTKIVSVLGAAVGSNIYGQLVQANGSLDWIALEKHLDELVPKIRKSLKSVAQAWTDGDLANHMIEVFSTKKNLRTDHNDDNEFKNWIKSYEGKEEVRRTVYEKFVFPVGGIEFDRGVAGLQDFLVGKLTDLKTKFDRQYKDYVKQRTTAYWIYFQQTGGYTGNHMSFWEWNRCCSSSFHFVASLEGLPSQFLKAQDQRLRELETNLASADIHNRIPKPKAGPPPGMRPWGS
jgi:hypothetical protein